MSMTNQDLKGMAREGHAWMEIAARHSMLRAYDAYTSGESEDTISAFIINMESLLEDLGDACRSCFDAEDLIDEDMPITKKAAYFVMKHIERNEMTMEEHLISLKEKLVEHRRPLRLFFDKNEGKHIVGFELKEIIELLDIGLNGDLGERQKLDGVLRALQEKEKERNELT